MKTIYLLAVLSLPLNAAAEHPIGQRSQIGATVQAAAPANSPRPSWTEQAEELVLRAVAMLGVDYRYGGNSPEAGFDCSGFVRHVFSDALGIALPHNAAQQSRAGKAVDSAQLRPGDLVFFNTLRHAFSHVGIYVGNGRFIHAPRAGQAVRIGVMTHPYWAQRYNGARRLLADS